MSQNQKKVTVIKPKPKTTKSKLNPYARVQSTGPTQSSKGWGGPIKSQQASKAPTQQIPSQAQLKQMKQAKQAQQGKKQVQMNLASQSFQPGSNEFESFLGGGGKKGATPFFDQFQNQKTQNQISKQSPGAQKGLTLNKPKLEKKPSTQLSAKSEEFKPGVNKYNFFSSQTKPQAQTPQQPRQPMPPQRQNSQPYQPRNTGANPYTQYKPYNFQRMPQQQSQLNSFLNSKPATQAQPFIPQQRPQQPQAPKTFSAFQPGQSNQAFWNSKPSQQTVSFNTKPQPIGGQNAQLVKKTVPVQKPTQPLPKKDTKLNVNAKEFNFSSDTGQSSAWFGNTGQSKLTSFLSGSMQPKPIVQKAKAPPAEMKKPSKQKVKKLTNPNPANPPGVKIDPNPVKPKTKVQVKTVTKTEVKKAQPAKTNTEEQTAPKPTEEKPTQLKPSKLPTQEPDEDAPVKKKFNFRVPANIRKRQEAQEQERQAREKLQKAQQNEPDTQTETNTETKEAPVVDTTKPTDGETAKLDVPEANAGDQSKTVSSPISPQKNGRVTYNLRKLKRILKQLKEQNNPLPERYKKALARYEDIREEPAVFKANYKRGGYNKGKNNYNKKPYNKRHDNRGGYNDGGYKHNQGGYDNRRGGHKQGGHHNNQHRRYDQNNQHNQGYDNRRDNRGQQGQYGNKQYGQNKHNDGYGNQKHNNYSKNKHHQNRGTSYQSNSITGRTIKLKEVDKQQMKYKNMIRHSKLKDELAKKDQDIKLIRLKINQLTPENYDRLFPFFLETVQKKKKTCEAIANFTMKGAWTQPKYISTYAKLTTELGKKKIALFGGKQNHFKKSLTSKIQSVFQGDIDVMWDTRIDYESMSKEDRLVHRKKHDAEIAKMDKLDKLDYDKKRRARITGNVQYIGELITLKFLPMLIFYFGTNTLLTDYLRKFKKVNLTKEITDKIEILNYESDLESLLAFLRKVGKNAEKRIRQKYEKTKKADKDMKKFKAIRSATKKTLQQVKDLCLGKHQNVPTMSGMKIQFTIDDIFNILNFLRNKKLVSQKMDGLIHNFIDFAEAGWTSMFENEGPKALDELEKDYYDKLDEFNRTGKESQTPQKKGKKRKQSYYDDEDSSNYSEEGEEEKFDEDDLFGGPNRKADKGKAMQKKAKLQSSIAKERLIKIFATTKDGKEESIEKAKLELKEFAKVHHVDHMINTYLANFHDGRLEECKTRLFMPIFMVEELGLSADELLKAFKYRCKKMINLYADYPGLFKFYGYFMQEWVLTKKLFTLQDIIKDVDCGDEEADEFYDIQDYWQKFMLGYIQYCHNLDGYDEKEVETFMAERLDMSGKQYERQRDKAIAKAK